MYGFNSVDAADGWTEYPDTIDPRQKDQTHTALVALNDVWKLGDQPGASALRLLPHLQPLALLRLRARADPAERVPHRDRRQCSVSKENLEEPLPCWPGRITSARRRGATIWTITTSSIPPTPYYYGPFIKVDGNNVTIAPVAPYIAGEGELSKYFHYYLGWRRDEISIDNQDLVTPANSWNKLVGLNSPKATLTFFPEESWYVPLSRVQLWQVVLHGRSRRDGGQHTATGARKPLTRWKRRAHISWSRARPSTRRTEADVGT